MNIESIINSNEDYDNYPQDQSALNVADDERIENSFNSSIFTEPLLKIS